jgi:hypothetical protein
VCSRGTHFTCFTGTKVQILTPEELRARRAVAVAAAACSLYLLYWYKNSHADACGAVCQPRWPLKAAYI